MTMYFHCTCININVHEKICIRNIGVQHSLEKNEAATMFFLKKTFSSSMCIFQCIFYWNKLKHTFQNKPSKSELENKITQREV